jgi:nucleoside-diphosphate-sugar epimerase
MHKNKLSIFLTGATGFLGAMLCERLLQTGHTVYATRRAQSSMIRYQGKVAQPIWIDLEEVDFDEFFGLHTIDCIAHCATDYGRKNVNPIQTIEANLILPLEIIHSAAGRVHSFINTDTILPKEISNYCLSKKQFAEWLQVYSDRLCAINVKLEHFYGPGDDVTKFASNIINALISNTDEIRLTSGEQRRDFIYIDDVVDAIALIIATSCDFNLGYHEFEVGRGESIRIRDFVTMARDLVGNTATHLAFGAMPYRENERMEITADISKLVSLGWSPRVTLKEGLLRTIERERTKLQRKCCVDR